MAEMYQTRDWTGRDLLDIRGEKIGTIDDIRYDDVTGAPKWLLAKTGLFGGKKMYVPASEVRSSDEQITVSFTKDRVKNSPKVGNAEFLSSEDEKDLYIYYGLEYAEPVGGRTGGSR